MKRLSVFMLILAIAVMSSWAQRTFVLLTGVSNYGIEGESAEEINLKNTTKDVKQLGKIFQKQGATVSILTSKYACRDSIEKRLNAITYLAKPEDKIIFFFSGHGDVGGMVLYGLDFLKYEKLIEWLGKAKTNNVFCFIDACHSGSVIGGINIYDNSQNVKPVFCMSSRADENSMEHPVLGNGFFSKAMIKGLRGKADLDKDNKITLIELFKYIHYDVTHRTETAERQQHPQLIGSSALHNTVIAEW